MSKSEKESDSALANLATDSHASFKILYKNAFESQSWNVLKVATPLILFIIYALYCIAASKNLGHALEASQIVLWWLGSLLISLYGLIAACLLSRHFVLRQESISLPMTYAWSTKLQLHWHWSELKGVVFARSDANQKTADQLILRFKPTESTTDATTDIAIKLQALDQVDLKKMIYAIVSNASQAVIEPPLETVALGFPTVSGIKHINFSSFTNLWDEEFSTRYSPTLFVPLQPDYKLRNETITITELIACGGSAAIYSAKENDGRQIIVKEAVIPKNSSEALRTKALELFNREALLLTKLDHPNIAKVFDHFVENDHHYEVLEYIDGLDLRRFVKERGPQPEDFVLNWAEQICQILIYLHSQNPPIIHRDLTPDNLVLRVDGELILIDFGAANAFVGTATGTMVGKQSYMPLEQLRGKAVPQSDIFSFGGTLFFLLTGHDPRPLEISKITVPNLSQELNPLLEKCTAIDSTNRYASSEELLHAIRTIRKQRVKEVPELPVE